uniref:Zinc finger FYVE-type containing 19 n=1 Tax=Pipistrellus kuhlii TaxID=59472 RepID=A0A7J8B6T3_PIPKU|nr:zinc finger FYVE-type containing 19 [Pipistrellus kuhlii]
MGRRAGCWLKLPSSCGRRTRGKSGSWTSPSAWPCFGDRTPTEGTLSPFRCRAFCS